MSFPSELQNRIFKHLPHQKTCNDFHSTVLLIVRKNHFWFLSYCLAFFFAILKNTKILYFGRKNFGAARNRRIMIMTLSSVKELVCSTIVTWWEERNYHSGSPIRVSLTHYHLLQGKNIRTLQKAVTAKFAHGRLFLPETCNISVRIHYLPSLSRYFYYSNTDI